MAEEEIRVDISSVKQNDSLPSQDDSGSLVALQNESTIVESTGEHIIVNEDNNRELPANKEPKNRDKDTENPIPHRVFGIFKTGGYLGKNILLWGNVKKHSYFPVVALLGPDWPTMILTYIFFCAVVYGDIVVSRNLFESPIVFYIFIAIGVIVIWFLLMTTLSNPGIIFRGEDNQLKDSKKSKCVVCEVDRPARAVHCGTCNVCCLAMDHHCPWMGKCIAKNNITFFYLSLGSLFVLLISSCVMVFVSDIQNAIK